jgi:hypothetical protein
MTRGQAFLHLLKKCWFFFALYAALSISLSFWLFEVRTAPGKDEKLQFFFSGYSYQKDDLSSFLEAKKPAYLRSVSYRFIETDSSSFADVYDTYGRSSADVLILPQSEINENKCLYDFLRVDEGEVTSLFGSVSLYQAQGYSYGIKVYDASAKSGWATSLFSYVKEGTEAQDYYLFFARSSLHSGSLGKQAKDGAITYAQGLEKL